MIEGLLAGVEDGSLFASTSAPLTVTAAREARVDFTGSELSDRVNAILPEYVVSEEWAELKRRHLGDRRSRPACPSRGSSGGRKAA